MTKTFDIFGSVLAGEYSEPRKVNGKGLFMGAPVKRDTESADITTTTATTGKRIPVAKLGSGDCIKKISVESDTAAVSVKYMLTCDALAEDFSEDIQLISATAITAGNTIESVPTQASLLKTVKEILGEKVASNVVLYAEVTTDASADGNLHFEVESISSN